MDVDGVSIVNPVPVEEVEPWLSALATTLLGSPWEPDFALRVERWRRTWDAERTWGVRDHGRWVATLATEERSMAVPGTGAATADVTVDALTAVSVAATHRRRGLLRSMITQSLAAAAERGDAMGVLLAAEWPIYGRYGYAPAARVADYTLHTGRAGAVVDRDPAGAVRQVDVDELAPLAHGLYERARRRCAGQIDRRGSWWQRRLGVDGFEAMPDGRATWILHESSGEADGFLAWKVTRDMELSGDMGAVEVLELVAASDRAYRNLWAYLCGIDLVGEVMLRERPVDEPVRWLLADGRALRLTYAGDFLWVRLLDVPAALSARGYATADRLVLEVVDTDGAGFGAGRYLLDACADGVSCTRTSEAADLRLPQRALAAVYLGDHSLRAVSVAGGVDELTAGAVARADAMFATAHRPWNGTGF